MRRFLTTPAALAAGLVLFLAGCSGESPTSPSAAPTPSGVCTVVITLQPASPITTYQGTAVTIQATVTRNGASVPDGTAIAFTTDFGFFLDTNGPTETKTTIGGVAVVSPGSINVGTAHVKAVLGCAQATVTIQFQTLPGTGPFISTVQPSQGTCAGGTTVTILGTGFAPSGSSVSTTRVVFGNAPASITSVADNQIVVVTPSRTLANPQVPEQVSVSVTILAGTAGQTTITKTNGFTYFCSSALFISSVVPNIGNPAGGDAVVVNGGNFLPSTNSSLATTTVTFCGKSAQLTAITNNSINLTTPAAPNPTSSSPQVCDVVVTVDVGLVTQNSTTDPQAFTYQPLALQPVIYSISPRTGPNDTPTRVTIFGNNFQFPEQVFFTGAACGAQLVEATLVSPVTPTQLVFSTPIAENGNVCLNNQLVDLVVLNPNTGKQATLSAAFKYYPCPQITAVGPTFGPYTGGTTVEIDGQNFESPAIVTGGGAAWQPVSVSASSIIALTPRINVTGCADVSAPVTVNSTGLSCPNAVGPNFTFYVKSVSPVITSVSGPVPQAGGVTVTVNGGNFIDNLSVSLAFPGGPTLIITPTIVSPTQLTFTAPAFTGTFLTQPCVSGTTPGSQNINTPVPMTITNIATTCSVTGQLVYIPADTTCHIAPLIITSTSLSAGTVGTPYSAQLTATGGSPPYTWSPSSPPGIPGGLSISSSGVVSGTPTTAGTFTFTVTVTDTALTMSSAAVSVTINP